jgi:uncharacterized protein (TIGR02145 family)
MKNIILLSIANIKMKYDSIIYVFLAIVVLLMLSASCKKDNDKKEVKPDVVTDIDGNEYHMTVIGNQTWLTENLKVTHYRNHDLIETTVPAAKNILGESQPRYQWAYDGDESNVNAYGRLYTWYAMNDSRNICPVGWHVATDDDWKELEMYLGMSQEDADASSDFRGTDQGSQIASRFIWTMGCTIVNGVNYATTEFNAIPAGYRHPDGTFGQLNQHTHWWTSTTAYDESSAWFRQLYYGNRTIIRGHMGKTVGYSVRCVKD